MALAKLFANEAKDRRNTQGKNQHKERGATPKARAWPDCLSLAGAHRRLRSLPLSFAKKRSRVCLPDSSKNPVFVPQLKCRKGGSGLSFRAMRVGLLRYAPRRILLLKVGFSKCFAQLFHSVQGGQKPASDSSGFEFPAHFEILQQITSNPGAKGCERLKRSPVKPVRMHRR